MATVQVCGVPSEKQLRNSLKSLKYTQNGLAAKHVAVAVEQFPNMKPSIKECTYSDPSIRGSTLAQLSGNIPTKPSDLPDQIQIPVRIWLDKGYPKDKPVIYINLAPNTEFTEAAYVKSDGRIELTQILSWKEGKSDLCMLIQGLQSRFNQQCPVRALKLRSASNQFTFRHLKPSHSTLSLRSMSEDTSSPLLKPTITKPSKHQAEITQMKSEIEEQKAQIQSLEDSLEDTKGKVAYYRNQSNELEEKLRAQKWASRSSFSTGVFDALMNHDVWREKQEKDDCKQRMEKMVTDMTEARETIGVLQADKEECQERLSILAVKYGHLKYAYCRLVKEKKFLIEQQIERQLNAELQSDSEESVCELPITMEQESSTESEQPLDNASKHNSSSLNKEPTEEVIKEVRASEGDQPAANTDKDEQTSPELTSVDELRTHNERLKKEVKELLEHGQTREDEIATLKKQLAQLKTEGEESQELLKNMLEQSMRKLKKYEYYADKEEQLEKQKQFLQAKYDRSVADRLEAEKKLKNENWAIRQKLKAAMNRTEQLENELKSSHRKSNSSEDSSSSVEDEPLTSAQQSKTEEGIGSILNDLDVLLSK